MWFVLFTNDDTFKAKKTMHINIHMNCNIVM